MERVGFLNCDQVARLLYFGLSKRTIELIGWQHEDRPHFLRFGGEIGINHGLRLFQTGFKLVKG